jgi:hypothetical protein
MIIEEGLHKARWVQDRQQSGMIKTTFFTDNQSPKEY